MSVRVRFAPSPTGQLHVGNARTALFNYLYARHTGGTFVLRIEDTDLEREQAGAEDTIFSDLNWLGLDWDEGPVRGSAEERGRYGPYRQSARAASYRDALARLSAKGAAYPCFCSDEVLDQDRQAAQAAARTTGYAGRCAAIDPEAAGRRVAAQEPHAWRFRAGRFGVVHDMVRGDVDFSSREVFDPVLVRRSGRPTYNFAVVVDDAAMAITHVLRGEDHLTNTALQLRIYEELGFRPPVFAHLSLILGPDGSPLSKRHGATSVGEMRARGYTPAALVNGLALLGWTPPEDRVILTRDEMIALFDLRAVNANPATFDAAKLDWLSGQSIRAMGSAERGAEIGRRLAEAGLISPGRSEAARWLERLGDLLATSLDRFDEAAAKAAFIFKFDPAAALTAGAREGTESGRVLETFARLFEAAGPLEDGMVPGLIEQAKSETGLKGRPLLHPLRAALTGQDSGPELARVVPLIDAAARLRLAPELLGPAARIRSVLAVSVAP